MICVSLGSYSFEECLNVLKNADFAEIRIDLLNFSDEQLKILFGTKCWTVATCRNDKLSDPERMEKLKLAILAGASFVDIEYEAETDYRNELAAFANANHTKVIISYHDYKKTPLLNELNEIINASKQWGADIVKLATMANSEKDSARIMGLYDNHSNLLAFCMGEKGVISRIAAPILGAPFTFAAPDAASATAPGQLTAEQFFNVYNILGVQ
jgi:3-dehydroquinate dehydratase I